MSYIKPVPDTSMVRGLSIPEACAQLGIGRTSIYALIKTGSLRPLKLGARTIIPTSQVSAILASPVPDDEESAGKSSLTRILKLPSARLIGGAK